MSQLEVIKKFVEERPYYTWMPSPRDIEAGEAVLESGGEKCYRQQSWVNDRGNTVHPGSHHAERYEFDFERCSHKNGWTQYDTDQDAWYFGVWVHVEERLTFTYCEGDISLVVCKDEESFQAELADMARCYGLPPPVFKVIGEDFKAEVYAKENAHGREIPEGGVETETMSDAVKLVLGGE
jgi:hypothetical protein